MDELLRHDGLAGQIPGSTCRGCGEAEGCLRCTDCFGAGLWCANCICESHTKHPLHIIQVRVQINQNKSSRPFADFDGFSVAMEWRILRTIQPLPSRPKPTARTRRRQVSASARNHHHPHNCGRLPYPPRTRQVLRLWPHPIIQTLRPDVTREMVACNPQTPEIWLYLPDAQIIPVSFSPW